MNDQKLTKEEVIKEIRNMWKFNYTLAPKEIFPMLIQLVRNAPNNMFKEE